MEEKKENNYRLNLVLLGESGVGKTTFKNRLLGQNFEYYMLPTIALFSEFFQFSSENLPNSNITINIWDTAGQEIYNSACVGVIKKADIIIFIRDHEKDNFEKWINIIKDNTIIESENLKLIFCLNKTDLLDEDEKHKINELLVNKAQRYKANSFLFSSKNDNDIENIRNQIKTFAVNLILNDINSHSSEINICLIGPSNVGKSSLVERIINDHFIESTITTIQIQKNTCCVDLKNNADIKFNYYDVPGQEQIIKRELNNKLLRIIDIFIFVNDNSNISAYNSIISKRINLKGKNIIFCVNKLDLIKDKKKFTKEYIKMNEKIIGKDGKKNLYLVSAFNGEGIDELKEKILEYANIINEQKDDKIDRKLTSVSRKYIYLEDNNAHKDKGKKKCCQ